MVLIGWVIACIVLAWLAFAGWLAAKQRIRYRQALMLAPLALVWRLDARALRRTETGGTLIYVVSHQSRIDPALMLSLLPEDTLHILDDYSARAGWMEPWRALARTIAFNPEHVFVSRRLVRVLRGGGRLAVYMPPDVEPGSRMFRLYRAVARIALRADAKVMPIHVAGAGDLPFSLTAGGGSWRGLFTRLKIRTLEPATIDDLVARAGPENSSSSSALFGRMEEVKRSDSSSTGAMGRVA